MKNSFEKIGRNENSPRIGIEGISKETGEEFFSKDSLELNGKTITLWGMLHDPFVLEFVESRLKEDFRNASAVILEGIQFDTGINPQDLENLKMLMKQSSLPITKTDAEFNREYQESPGIQFFHRLTKICMELGKPIIALDPALEMEALLELKMVDSRLMKADIVALLSSLGIGVTYTGLQAWDKMRSTANLRTREKLKVAYTRQFSREYLLRE